MKVGKNVLNKNYQSFGFGFSHLIFVDSIVYFCSFILNFPSHVKNYTNNHIIIKIERELRISL